MREMLLRSMILAAICMNAAHEALGSPETQEITALSLPVMASSHPLIVFLRSLSAEKRVRYLFSYGNWDPRAEKSTSILHLITRIPNEPLSRQTWGLF